MMTRNSNMPPAAAGVPGRFILKYLQENENEDGATVSDVVQHLKKQPGAGSQPPDELNKMVETILKGGAELGFLERKGSKFIHLLAKGMCCMRRRKRRCRRRRRSSRRRRRRRSCSCRRRRRRRSCSRRRRRRRRSCRRRRKRC